MGQKRLRAIAFGLSLAIGLVSTPAAADPYEAALIRAVAAKEQALDVNEPARWQEALRLFQEVDAIRSTDESKYEIGFAAERLKQHDLALEEYERALELGLGGTASEHASAFVAEHAPAMGRLDVHGPEGTRVVLNDLARGRLPLDRPLVVFVGKLAVQLIHPEGWEEARTVEVAARDLSVLTAAEAPPPAPAKTAAPSPDSSGRSPVAERPRGATAAWLLVGGGLAVGLSGGAFVVVSGSTIDSKRRELEDHCDVLDGPDACRTARRGHVEDAQHVVDGIATWKAVRTGSWVAVGAGVASLAAGLVLSGGGVELFAGPTPHGLALGAVGAF